MVEKKLEPVDGRKSFYGKAKAIEHDNGTVELKSYNTIVARIEEGVFYRMWNGYSATTMRHINSFLSEYDVPFPGGAKWWKSMNIEEGVRFA